MLTFALIKNVFAVVQLQALVCLKTLTQKNLLDTLNEFIRTLENFLETFEAKVS